MPLIKSSGKKAVSQNIREMMASGYPQKQAIAASLSNQRKAKAEGLAKGGPTGEWIQGAREKMERKGTVGSLRAAHGVKKGETIPTNTLKKDVAKGGKIAKKAQFALNVRK